MQDFPAQSPTQSGTDNSGLREIRRDTDVDSILRRLCRYHSLLTIRRAGEAQSHATAVLALQRPLGRLLLDAVPDTTISTGTPLNIHTRFDGAELVFWCTAIGTTMFDGEPALVVSLPKTVRQRDRRTARRLPMPADQELPRSVAKLNDAPAQIHFDFQIVDISPTGIGAQTSKLPSALLVGDRLELRLELPGRSLPLSATLRTQRPEADGVRIGLAFSELQPRQLDLLAAVLLQIERYQLRNTFGNGTLF